MKISKEQAQKNRQQIIDVASQLFRERGFDGIGVADLMRAAGFTHGGFYGHFESKEALMLAACQHAFDEAALRWQKQTGAHPIAFESIASKYCSKQHRDNPAKAVQSRRWQFLSPARMMKCVRPLQTTSS